jgi:L-ascorbate metabolism protein UlaG (beta-lactamase superfamily)
MVITWFGLSSFKISSGNLTLVTDPFSKNTGLTPPRVATDIAVISNIQNDLYNNKESLGGDSTFVIDGPGEFDAKGLFVHGIQAKGNEKQKENGFDYTTIYSIKMEDIRLGFLGSISQKELTDSQIEELGEIDILFVPVGGHTVCDAEQAVSIVNQIEPHIVIPMHYSQKGLKLSLDKIDVFLKEIGSKAAPQEKLTIKKSEIAEKESEVVVLESQR